MAYDESLAERIRVVFGRKRSIVAKKMFGGLAFLLHGNVCVGVWKDSLLARVGPQEYRSALDQPHVKVFDITGKALKGWVLVKPEGIVATEDLEWWINRSTKFVIQLQSKIDD